MSNNSSTTLYAAIAGAIRNAEDGDRRWPCMADIGHAADEHEVDFQVLAAAFGILPAARDAHIRRHGLPYQHSFWHNAREIFSDDDRVGVLTSAEAVHAFSDFLATTGIECQMLVLTTETVRGSRGPGPIAVSATPA